MVVADSHTSALIIGGGIAGLTAAIALRARGVSARVFEKAGDVAKIQGGSGLRLGYNATRAFKHLGILDELVEIASPLRGVRFETKAGKYLGSTSHIEGEEHLGIRRPPLHEFLVRNVPEGILQPGAEFVRFEQDDSGVTAHFANGETARGDVLIGADGLYSTVRAQIHGEAEPRYAGYCARRGALETDLVEKGQMRAILGSGARFTYFPVGGRWIYWSAASSGPPGGKETSEELKQRVLEDFGDFPDVVAEFVQATDDSNTFLADTYDRDPLSRWGEGRVTLLGDSAHPMTWDRGQGACQGIEGAVLLATQIADADDLPAALRAWEKDRIPHTKQVVLGSRRMGKLCQSDKPVTRLLRNQAIRILTGPGAKREGTSLLVDY